MAPFSRPEAARRRGDAGRTARPPSAGGALAAGRRGGPGAGERALGLYVGIPFCRAKCSFCNFASGAFPAALMGRYVAAVEHEIRRTVAGAPALPVAADSVYCGGGTPTLLAPGDFAALLRALRRGFAIAPGAEITCEAMPGTLSDAVCAGLAAAGVNRVSLGVQTWLAAEARKVGRGHTPEGIQADLERLRGHGIGNLSLDLIAGLPGQTAASWRESVRRTIAAGVPHVSVYLFELDEESRLGAELLSGGRRYHAAEMPDPDATADWYAWAAGALARAGLEQYEISNFARAGFASRHNEGYWLRRPYLGFGLDAHSFLRQPVPRRWGNTAGMDEYLGALEAGRWPRREETALTPQQELEEALFLGLRRNAGLEWQALVRAFGAEPVAAKRPVAAAMADAGWLRESAGRIALTPRGRLFSNEVFARFLA